LQSLYVKTGELRTIQQIVDDVLDVETRVGSLKNKELTLLTAKSTQATQVRYRQRSTISALRRRGLDVSFIKIKVQPAFSAKNPENSKRYLPPQIASQIQQAAAFIQDESLRNALIKLSKSTRMS
jgi:hypothetical protein